MTTTYTTADGDTVDEIAWRYYGAQTGRVVEQLLAANPGLADAGAVLPSGLVIALPVVDLAAKRKGVRLWD